MFNPTSGPRWPLLITLLAVAAVLLFGVSSGLAREQISNGGTSDAPAGGDPIDSNDYGSGGGGSGDDVEDSAAPLPGPGHGLFLLSVGDLVFVILPDASLGTVGFTLHVVDLSPPAGETRNAP